MADETGVNSGEVVTSAEGTVTEAESNTDIQTEGEGGSSTEGEAGSADPQDGEQHIQTPEQRAAWAKMRREADEAKVAKQELARRDKWVADNYGVSHGITTWEQYEAAVAQSAKANQEAQKRQLEEYHGQKEKQLRDAGYDTQQIKEFFRTDPVFIQLQQENAALKQHVLQGERDKQADRMAREITSDHANLREKYGDLVPEDLKELDEGTKAYCRQGMPLRAAWLMANEDRIVSSTKTRTTQKTIRDINSKSHLETEKPTPSVTGKSVDVSDDQMHVWKRMFPGETEAQIKKRVLKYQKKAGK